MVTKKIDIEERSISFSGIYDPRKDSPAIKKLIREWKKELAVAIAKYVITKDQSS